jgi:hypothetical protein
VAVAIVVDAPSDGTIEEASMKTVLVDVEVTLFWP